MSATVYLARAALDQVEATQAVMDAHVLHAATGRCSACQMEWPCDPVVEANATLLRYGRLPRRRPGATVTAPRRPREASFGWFSWAVVP